MDLEERRKGEFDKSLETVRNIKRKGECTSLWDEDQTQEYGRGKMRGEGKDGAVEMSHTEKYKQTDT